MVREPRSGVLLATAEVAAKIGRLLRRPFTGYGGVEVRDTIDGVSIGLAASSARGGGGNPAGRWVIVTGFATGLHSAIGSSLMVRATTLTGDPVGEEFEVFAISYTDTPGHVGMANLSLCAPPVSIGDYVKIEIAPEYPYTGNLFQDARWFVCWPYVLVGCPEP